MSKTETNIALVPNGMNLSIQVREGIVEGTHLSPDIIQKACRTYVFDRGVAVVPHPTEKNRVLIARSHKVKDVNLKGTNWSVTIKDSGQPSRTYSWSRLTDRSTILELIERELEAYLEHNTDLWNIDSPHIWYQPNPFISEEGIKGFRRYTVGTVDVEDYGVGIVVDVSTAFFSEKSLAYFFALDIDQEQKNKRLRHFEKLTNRQKGQKGTLWYHMKGNEGKCYFSSAPPDAKCSTTGKIVVDHQEYESLYDYYKDRYPDFKCSPNDRAVKVSFEGYDRPTWVAAKCLYIRIMNDALPYSLSQVDKIAPKERRELLQLFWDTVSDIPLKKLVDEPISTKFWEPSEDRLVHLLLPELLYHSNNRLKSPNVRNVNAYRQYYRDRQEMLDELGCYSSPPTTPRTVYLAYPKTIQQTIITVFKNDLNHRLQQLTRRRIVIAEPIPYETLEQATEELRTKNAEIVVFILNDEPMAYHKVAYDQNWHIKRLTPKTLQKAFLKRDKNHKSWESFITMNTLGIVRLFNAVPYAIASVGQYQAQLIIDVGHDRRHFALSLLIARGDKTTDFSLYTEVHPKSDHQHDTINPTILCDTIFELFKRMMVWGVQALESLVVLRDGEFRTLNGNSKEQLREENGVLAAITRLKESGYLSKHLTVHMADYRKQTNRTIRIWDVEGNGQIENTLEGTGVIINSYHLVLTTTGASTLHQGTAHPIVLTGNGSCPDIVAIGQSIFDAAQLNWSSPKVAQRDAETIRAADEELKARANQEMRRLKD
jgi:hypothetical protein